MSVKRDFLSVMDAEKQLSAIVRKALSLKKELRSRTGHIKSKPLRDRYLGLIFEKSSTRTRVSFEVAMRQLGGSSIYLNASDMQLGRGESISDTGRVLSRYLDIIAYRAFSHTSMKELAHSSSLPVINALDDIEHPCQAVADIMTIMEHFPGRKGLKIAYFGDGNNVCNSLILASAVMGMNFIAATPPSHAPPSRISELAASVSLKTHCRIEIVDDPRIAARNADVLYTDVWVSMGQEKEREERERIFMPYQLNSSLLDIASSEAIIMHCLPAHRELEITSEVLDGRQSVVFDQAENRLHVQKAILLWLLKGRI